MGCEDFRMFGSIKNGVSVLGRPLSVMKVLCNLGKAKANQRLNQYYIYCNLYNHFVGI